MKLRSDKIGDLCRALGYMDQSSYSAGVKFCAFCGNSRFVAKLTKCRLVLQSWTNLKKCTPSYPLSWRYILLSALAQSRKVPVSCIVSFVRPSVCPHVSSTVNTVRITVIFDCGYILLLPAKLIRHKRAPMKGLSSMKWCQSVRITWELQKLNELPTILPYRYIAHLFIFLYASRCPKLFLSCRFSKYFDSKENNWSWRVECTQQFWFFLLLLEYFYWGDSFTPTKVRCVEFLKESARQKIWK